MATNNNEIHCPDCGYVKTRTREHCIYCHRNVPMGLSVPDVDHNAHWEALAISHKKDCEWVLTRAHRQ